MECITFLLDSSKKLAGKSITISQNDFQLTKYKHVVRFRYKTSKKWHIKKQYSNNNPLQQVFHYKLPHIWLIKHDLIPPQLLDHKGVNCQEYFTNIQCALYNSRLIYIVYSECVGYIHIIALYVVFQSRFVAMHWSFALCALKSCSL